MHWLTEELPALFMYEKETVLFKPARDLWSFSGIYSYTVILASSLEFAFAKATRDHQLGRTVAIRNNTVKSVGQIFCRHNSIGLSGDVGPLYFFPLGLRAVALFQ